MGRQKSFVDTSSGVATEVDFKTKAKSKEPELYKVILLNDDYTPMDFVVDILINFFSKDKIDATRIMLEVHYKGRGVCGVYTKEIAETKVVLVNDYSRSNEYPLLCEMDKA